MSANPQHRPFVTGDLDLLISRSLDGDLPGEEERERKSLLQADAAARARYDAMARLVGRLEELPDPEAPFALSTRVTSQVENDTVGIAATLHRFGFYFRPATVGVFIFGIVAVVLTSTVMVPPPKPAATVADGQLKAQPAPAAEDDGRVNVFFADSSKKDAAAPAAGASVASAELARPSAVPSRSQAGDAKGNVRQEPVLVASAEAPREKEESLSFAPERDDQPLAPAAPAPAAAPPAAVASRAVADENVAERASMQKSVGSEAKRKSESAPQAAGVSFAGASVQVVGKTADTLRISPSARLEGLAGPFEATYRLELDGAGRVTTVVRLSGGSGSEPSGLPARLKELSFAPVDAARTEGAVDVKVRLP